MSKPTFIFRVGCVVLSICATLWPIHLFHLDQDSLTTELKELHTSHDSSYPSIRLCFARAILRKHEKPSGNKLGTKNQLKNGSHPYRPNILRIEDYISSITINHRNKKRPKFTRDGIDVKLHQVTQLKGNFSHIILRRSRPMNCIEIGIPFKENKGIHGITVAVRKDVFKKDSAPTRNEVIGGTRKLTIAMSFKGSSFRVPSHNAGELLLNDHLNRTCSDVVFNIKGMEILHRRNKKSSRCFDYDHQGLFLMMNRIVRLIGCMPVGWEVPSSLPNCPSGKSKKSVYKVLVALKFLEYSRITNACRSASSVQLEYNFDDLMSTCSKDDDTIQITALYNRFLYKETKMVQAYTEWDLFSTIGVIIGFFYGWALINIPDMARSLHKKIRTHILRRPSKQPKIHERLDIIKYCMNEVYQEMEKAEANMKNEMEKAKENTFVVYQRIDDVYQEMEKEKKNIFLIKNHMRQYLQKKEYETVV